MPACPVTAILERFTKSFFLWTVLGGIVAVLYPPSFTWFTGILIPIGLGVIMLGMGLTLAPDDFRRVLRYPRQVLVGVLLQFTVMPALGWTAAEIFGLPAPLAAGLILTCCCPGGVASNVISFLARANVGLSVSMTAISTMCAVAMTPLLTGLLVGNRMDVDVLGLLRSTLVVVILPVMLGVFLNQAMGSLTRRLNAWFPAVAVVVIILIVGSVLGKSASGLFAKPAVGLRLVSAVLLVHVLGFLLGYGLGRLALRNEASARTVSIEVGMQNSGLSVQLARAHFADPLTAFPGAVSAICHCVLGSLAAALWRGRRAVD